MFAQYNRTITQNAITITQLHETRNARMAHTWALFNTGTNEGKAIVAGVFGGGHARFRQPTTVWMARLGVNFGVGQCADSLSLFSCWRRCRDMLKQIPTIANGMTDRTRFPHDTFYRLTTTTGGEVAAVRRYVSADSAYNMCVYVGALVACVCVWVLCVCVCVIGLSSASVLA